MKSFAIAGATLAGGVSAAALHTELLYAFALCILVGIPASALFGGAPRDLKPRGWRIQSQTTADAVSSPPAPGPSKVISRIASPWSITALNGPSTAARG